MNSYEACSRHVNGHLPYCCQCQEESLRDLLREIANCPAFEELDCDPAAMIVRVNKELWWKLASLRNGKANA